MDDKKHSGTKGELAARIGRGAGRFVKQAKPRVKRMAADAKPLLNKATQYATEHQDEIRAAGAKALRARVRGPLGMAFDAVSNASRPPAPKDEAPATDKLSCAKCGAVNPAGSRYCNQCASSLTQA